MTPALAFAPLARFDSTGIVPATPGIQYYTVGINLDGQFYLYGDTATQEERTIVPALAGLIIDVSVQTYGQLSPYGERDYLDIHIASTDQHVYVLRLPCHNGQWSYRSLLGCLLALDLSDTAVKIEPKRGKAATFIRVSLDPQGSEPVIADSIGPDRDELEIGVNRLRHSLGLEPQFS